MKLCQAVACGPLGGKHKPIHYFPNVSRKLPKHHEIALTGLRPDEAIKDKEEAETGLRPKVITKALYKKYSDLAVAAYYKQDLYSKFLSCIIDADLLMLMIGPDSLCFNLFKLAAGRIDACQHLPIIFQHSNLMSLFSVVT